MASAGGIACQCPTQCRHVPPCHGTQLGAWSGGGEVNDNVRVPHRTAPHRTAPHRTAPCRTVVAKGMGKGEERRPPHLACLVTFVPSLENCSHEVSSECVNSGYESGASDTEFVLGPGGVLPASVCATSSSFTNSNNEIAAINQ